MLVSVHWPLRCIQPQEQWALYSISLFNVPIILKHLFDIQPQEQWVACQVRGNWARDDSSSSSDTSAGQRFPPHNRTLGVRE